MKNTCIITNHNSRYKKIANLTLPNIIRYSDKHSLDFYKSEQQFVDDKYIGWNKLILIQKILPLYEWVFYIDTDCLVVNSDKKIDDIIDNRYSIIIGENYSPDEWYQGSSTNLEMGTILLQNTPVTFDILNELTRPPYDLSHIWAEQFQFMKLLWNDTKLDNSVKKIDTKQINTISKYFSNPVDTFVYHCAGSYDEDTKIKMLQNILPLCF